MPGADTGSKGCVPRSVDFELRAKPREISSLIASQEVAGADAGDEGRVPRTVDVELREDLVDCCAAGEVATVVGLVRVLDTAADPGACRSHGGQGFDALMCSGS